MRTENSPPRLEIYGIHLAQRKDIRRPRVKCLLEASSKSLSTWKHHWGCST